MASVLSDTLGYASIGCWLGAQFPQVIENHRRRSVEGLAWPFLANWLAGDASNLVGCILTHQLPFQTYLAVYFCLVDFTLVGQYVYYASASKPTPPFPARRRSASAATITQRRLSIERPPTHYRTLSHVAANVAAAAALAAQHEEQARRHSKGWGSHEVAETEETWDDDDDEVDEAALARLADSFHSEGGRGRKKVSWSRERGGSVGRRLPSASAMSPIAQAQTPLHLQTSPTLDGTEELDVTRGRPLAREVPYVESPDTEWAPAAPTTAQRRSSRASRKGASMVFLSVWALFSIGAFNAGKRGTYQSTRGDVGRVLDTSELAPVANLAGPSSPSDVMGDILDHGLPPSSASDGIPFDQLQFVDEIPPEDPHESPSTDYIIGRISAWICTTLYLTSRLPQIWKNYVRKSVEGLSMSLFVCAFLGNTFYVLSILTSPKLSLPESEASVFLRESIPYLLGSGGTLMFDVTIVTQSFLYRPKAHLRGRRSSRTINEEEEGLLSADATGADDTLVSPSRRRLTVPSDGGP